MHTFYNHNEVLGELRINQEKNDFKEQYDPVVVTVNLYHLANKVYELVLVTSIIIYLSLITSAFFYCLRYLYNIF